MTKPSIARYYVDWRSMGQCGDGCCTYFGYFIAAADLTSPDLIDREFPDEASARSWLAEHYRSQRRLTARS